MHQKNIATTRTLCVGLLAVLLMFAPAAFAGEPSKSKAEAPKELPNPIRLVLPPAIYAVPGVEMNVYFDNVVLTPNPANYVFDVACSRGIQQAERWTYTPAPGEIGESPFQLEVRNAQNEVIARAESTLKVVSADAGAGRAVSMLIIGDSLTAASVYPQRLLELCQGPGNPKLKLIGSYGPGGVPGVNRHEGYGGWTAQRFATHYTPTPRQGDRKGRGSPFLYLGEDGKPKLDFARYCKEFNDARGPDFVTIFLGCNDTFSSTDETIEENIASMFKYYDMLIEMIHGVRPDTVIGAMILVPPAATQDAFGANYRCGQTRWQYKRNQHRVVERMLAKYGGRQKEFVELVPIQLNLDCRHNYPVKIAPWNAQATAEGLRLANGVHPASAGYNQIGDSLYAWLKSQLNPK